MKEDKVKLDIFPRTNENYISVSYDCIQSNDGYRLSHSTLDWLVKTIIGNSHAMPKNMEKEISDDDNTIKVVIERETLIIKDRYKNHPAGELKKKRFSG